MAGPWVAAHFVVLVVAGPWVAAHFGVEQWAQNYERKKKKSTPKTSPKKRLKKTPRVNLIQKNLSFLTTMTRERLTQTE